MSHSITDATAMLESKIAQERTFELDVTNGLINKQRFLIRVELMFQLKSVLSNVGLSTARCLSVLPFRVQNLLLKIKMTSISVQLNLFGKTPFG